MTQQRFNDMVAANAQWYGNRKGSMVR